MPPRSGKTPAVAEIADLGVWLFANHSGLSEAGYSPDLCRVTAATPTPPAQFSGCFGTNSLCGGGELLREEPLSEEREELLALLPEPELLPDE